MFETEDVIVGIINIMLYLPIVFLALYFILSFVDDSKEKDFFDIFKGMVIFCFTVLSKILNVIVLKPLKWLFNMIITILPLLNFNRNPTQWVWHENNINQTLIITSFMAFGALFINWLLNLYSTRPYPILLTKYPTKTIVVSSFILFCLTLLFIVGFSGNELDNTFNEGKDPYMYESSFGGKTKWLFSHSKDYLKISIITSLLLTGLGFLTVYLTYSPTSAILTQNILYGGLVILILSLIYTYIDKIPILKDLIQYDIFRKITNVVFLLPELFKKLVERIYVEFKYTPKIIYGILFFQIITAGTYLAYPILQKFFYEILQSNKIDFKTKIKGENLFIDTLKKKINELQKYSPSDDFPYLTSNLWDIIIKKNYNNKNKESELKTFLQDNNYNDCDMVYTDDTNPDLTKCKNSMKKLITYIQVHTGKIIDLKNKIKDHEKKIIEYTEIKNKQSFYDKGEILLNHPVYLNKEKTIATGKQILDLHYGFTDQFNYGLSFWVFLHSLPPNYGKQFSNYTKILDYNGKPTIYFNNLEKKLKVTIKTISGENVEHIIDDILLQKWHNIVVNYDSGILDIFLNNRLIASYPGVVTFTNIDENNNSTNDMIIVGEKNGISGGICNVLYFPRTITRDRIKSNYMYLKYKNPPVV